MTEKDEPGKEREREYRRAEVRILKGTSCPKAYCRLYCPALYCSYEYCVEKYSVKS